MKIVDKKGLKAEFDWMTDAYIYKHTSNKTMPHFKQGKLLFDLDAVRKWLTSNPVVSQGELSSQLVTEMLIRPRSRKARRS